MNEKLNGEINIIDLIKKIRIINSEINIYCILENKNEEIEKLLKLENIFYNDEIKINDLIKCLKELKNSDNELLKKEIYLLKDIINKQENELLNYKNIEKNDVIYVFGEKNVGKSTIINNIKNITELKYEFEEINNYLLENRKLNKIIFIIELNYKAIKINYKNINKIISQNNICIKNINIIFNKTNKYSLNKKIAKEILKKFNIIGFIKLNNYCDYSVNKKSNYKKENKKLEKEYLKIIKKINKGG